MTRLLLFLPLALTLSGQVPDEPTAPSIDALSWMTGYWSKTEDQVQMEEIWSPPGGGMLLGVHRDVRGPRSFFEYLRIEQRKDGIYYVPAPGGKPASTFKMTELEDGRVVFENPKNDFPKRISYWLEDEDTLTAHIDDGKGVKSQQWTWERRELIVE